MPRKISQKILKRLDEALAKLGRKQLEEVIKTVPVTTSLKSRYADIASMSSDISSVAASVSAMGISAEDAAKAMQNLNIHLPKDFSPEAEEEDLDIQQELSQ